MLSVRPINNSAMLPHAATPVSSQRSTVAGSVPYGHTFRHAAAVKPASLTPLRQGEAQLAQELVLLREIIGPACRLQRRKKRPASFQLLLDPSLHLLN